MKDNELNELNDDLKRIFKTLQKKSGETVDESVETVSKEYNMSVDKAAEKIYKLWKKGYIDIENKNQLKSLVRYISSVESSWFHIITTILIIVIALVFLVQNPPLLYLRYILGSLFVLYLPGYALIEALYPRGDELEALERLALSIGLSLALVPLVGLALNYTPWGIRLTPVTISLALLTEALAFYALYRKYQYYRVKSTA